MRKLMCLMLSMVLVFGCFGMNVSAETCVYPRVNHSYDAADDFASDEWQTALRGAYLGSGMVSIARNGVRSINISGDTTATQYCDKIILMLYVERSTSYATGYSTYKDYVYEAEDVYALVKGISNIPVERGYYYRVAGVHAVTHNGVTEVTDSVTDPIDYR